MIRASKALERSAAEHQTTNNRMELLAVVMALRALTASTAIEIRSDSKYTIDCCSTWLPGWARGWRRRAASSERGPADPRWLAGRVYTGVISLGQGHNDDPGNGHVDGLLNDAMDRLAAGDATAHERRLEWTAPLSCGAWTCTRKQSRLWRLYRRRYPVSIPRLGCAEPQTLLSLLWSTSHVFRAVMTCLLSVVLCGGLRREPVIEGDDWLGGWLNDQPMANMHVVIAQRRWLAGDHNCQ